MSFNNMKKQFELEWNNPDVHARTAEMRKTIETQFPDLIDKINALEPKYGVVRERLVKELYPNDQLVVRFLQLCDARQRTRDGAMLGVSCGGCLVMLFCLVAHYEFDPSLVLVFKDTMYDMGTTCLQGYTHRMLSLILALMRDMEMQEGVERSKRVCSCDASSGNVDYI